MRFSFPLPMALDHFSTNVVCTYSSDRYSRAVDIFSLYHTCGIYLRARATAHTSRPRKRLAYLDHVVYTRTVSQERRRTKGATFCELCSPSLLLCVLVYGYSLSDVIVFPEKVCSSVGSFEHLNHGNVAVASCHAVDLVACVAFSPPKVLSCGCTTHSLGEGSSGAHCFTEDHVGVVVEL